MKKHKYKSKTWKKKVDKYWKPLKVIEDTYYKSISKLEKKMTKETGIDDIEFFMPEGEVCGIGNASRTMELILRKY